jgi:hypothetical protein
VKVIAASLSCRSWRAHPETVTLGGVGRAAPGANVRPRSIKDSLKAFWCRKSGCEDVESKCYMRHKSCVMQQDPFGSGALTLHSGRF